MTDTHEAVRLEFERYFLESRKSKGANRKPTFERFEDGTYKDDHTQRHWWTWQNALLRRIPELEAERDRLSAELAGRWLPDHWAWMTHPDYNGGQPVPVRFIEDGGDLYYQPFDIGATEFEWSRRDAAWKQIFPTAAPATQAAQQGEKA